MLFLVVWAGYRFSIGSLTTPEERPHSIIDSVIGSQGRIHNLVYCLVEAKWLPAPELLVGVLQLQQKNSKGHSSHFFGKRGNASWRFFPVVLSIKSPLPFLVLVVVGYIVILNRVWTHGAWAESVPAISALCILAVCLPSSINLGVRHILPIYPLLAIVVGLGADYLVGSTHPRLRLLLPACVLAILSWQVISSVRSHPDYLAYFNELVERPERIVIGSDLDWGQDLKRLVDKLGGLGIKEVSLAYFGTADLSKHGLPATHRLAPNQVASGWIAISETELQEDGFSWLQAYKPVARVGSSIKLYFVPN
jgi:hypothetical protein